MPTTPESVKALELIRRFAAEQELECEDGSRPGEVVVVLPGESKLKTTCSMLAGDRMLSVSAFVIRNPDENHRDVYGYLLRRNLSLPGLSYAIDESGDVYLTGQVPITAVDEDYLDRMLGVVVAGTDEAFDDLLVMGFLTSMRKEWQWRISREESLKNLEPFREILEKEEAESDRTHAHEDAGEDEEPPTPQG